MRFLDYSILIEKYESGWKILAKTVENLHDDVILDFKRDPKDWSIRQVIHHICEAELHAFLRIRSAIAEPGLIISPFNQEKWEKSLNYNEQDIALSIDAVKFAHLTNGKLLRSITLEQWNNTISHLTFGNMTVTDIVSSFSDHLLHHLEQINKRLDQYNQSIHAV